MNRCSCLLLPCRENKKGEGQVEEAEEEEGIEKGGLKIKILLTREELEWLLLQLKEKGGKGLEEVLVEIERGRGKNEGWKPSLESIMEIPEAQTVEMG